MKTLIPSILLAVSISAVAQTVVTPTNNLPPITDSTPRITSSPNGNQQNTAVIKSVPQVLWDLKFTDWEDDHLHWPAPCSLKIYDDGTFKIEASYLANMLRTGEVLDTGEWRTFLIALTIKDPKTGNVIWADWMSVASLGYKHERRNLVALASYPDALELLRHGHTLHAEQQIAMRLVPPPPRIRPQ